MKLLGRDGGEQARDIQAGILTKLRARQRGLLVPLQAPTQ